LILNLNLILGQQTKKEKEGEEETSSLSVFAMIALKKRRQRVIPKTRGRALKAKRVCS
jgi:hypothetical protein